MELTQPSSLRTQSSQAMAFGSKRVIRIAIERRPRLIQCKSNIKLSLSLQLRNLKVSEGQALDRVLVGPQRQPPGSSPVEDGALRGVTPCPPVRSPGLKPYVALATSSRRVTTLIAAA